MRIKCPVSTCGVENECPVSTCRGCGAKIVFLKSQVTGAILPAQLVRSVYSFQLDLLAEPSLLMLDKPRGQITFISHFETCPNANDFSASNRRL